MRGKNLATTMGDAVAGTVDSAETIHRKIASIPIDILDNVVRLEEPLSEVRKIQDQAIGAIYELVRGINKEVTHAASDLLEAGTDVQRNTTAKVVKPRKVERTERVPKAKAS